MTEIFRYKSGGENMIVIEENGKLRRNHQPIEFTKTGRKYVVISYSNRKQYLCKNSDCYKNTYKQGFCTVCAT